MNAVKQPTRIRAGQTGGVVRRVDDLGRIVIPVEIRRRFGIEIRDRPSEDDAVRTIPDMSRHIG